jgi:ZIP family zinc transporter
MIDPLAIVYAILAGAGATALGAAIVLVLPKLSHRMHDSLLAFSTGLMGGMVAFQILPEAFRTAQGEREIVLLGLIFGFLFLFATDRATHWFPTPEPFRSQAVKGAGAPTGFLVFLALSVHNIPEGLATGLGYAHGVTPFGNGLALAVTIQNIPEGLIVAVPLRGEGHSRISAFILAASTGLIEPVCSVIAMIAVGWAASLLPAGLGFAAGAMTYVVAVEMVPESWKHGYHWEATAAAIGGVFIVILLKLITF